MTVDPHLNGDQKKLVKRTKMAPPKKTASLGDISDAALVENLVVPAAVVLEPAAVLVVGVTVVPAVLAGTVTVVEPATSGGRPLPPLPDGMVPATQ